MGVLSTAPLCSVTCRLQASVLAKGALVAWAEVRRTEPGLCSSSAKVEEEGQKQHEGSKEQDQGPAAEEEVHWESLPLEGDTLGLASFCNCAGQS